MPTRLILIRHGITVWNLKKRYCGWKDVPLSAQGKKQVKALGERLKLAEIDKIFCSDRLRAVQTAGIIFPEKTGEKVSGLREMNFGCFEGLTHDEILKRCPVLYRRWLKNPSCVSMPGGERLQDFKKRVLGSMRKIIAQNKNKTIAVVAHGGVISIFLLSLKKKQNSFWKYIPCAASLSIVEFRGKEAKIKTFNDTLHLNE